MSNFLLLGNVIPFCLVGQCPTDERTWHGTIVGIPYDFRPPTPEKVRNTFWNKETSKIFLSHAFGIGWSINFYPFVHPKPVSQQTSDMIENQ